MSFRMPALLARLNADQRLIDACFEYVALDVLKKALIDGANPNYEKFHRVMRERTGTHFRVRQWWGGKRDEPIHSSTTFQNYWQTPLSCAVDQGKSAFVDALLEAGANPWALGNGGVGCPRLSPMAQIFQERSGHLYMVGILDRHFDHIVACHALVPEVAAHNNLDRFENVAEQSVEATSFIKKLKRHLDAQNLQEETAPVYSPSVARVRL